MIVGILGMTALVTLQTGGSSGFAPSWNMDAMFIEQMIPHHEDAIAMAELALTRADHAEVKQLAEDVIRTQSAEIEQMRGWYRDWYGREVPERSPGMMGGEVDLERLKNAEPFDKAFIEAMVPHHEMALMMAQMAGSGTDHSELRDLTQSIIETQSEEIDRMRQWHNEWY